MNTTLSTSGAPAGRLWTAQDVAGYLGVPIATLYQWRYLGTGPVAYRVGRHLRYDPATVRAWLNEHASRERNGHDRR
jgi:hypothetical protein